MHARKPRDNRTKVDTQVRGGPESVPPDGSVPGDVPVQTDCGGCHSDRREPDTPRYISNSIENGTLGRGRHRVGNTVCHRLTSSESGFNSGAARYYTPDRAAHSNSVLSELFAPPLYR